MIFPNQSELVNITANTTVINSPLFGIQDTVIPFSAWALITVIAFAFLAISILVPDKGELITALIAFALLTMSWITSSLISFVEYIAIETAAGGTIIQPITTIYADHYLSGYLLPVWFIALANLLFAIFHLTQRSVDTRKQETLE